MTIFPFCFALGEPEAVDPAFYIENLIEMEMEEGKGGGRRKGRRRVVARSKPKSHKNVGDELGVGSNNVEGHCNIASTSSNYDATATSQGSNNSNWGP